MHGQSLLLHHLVQEVIQKVPYVAELSCMNSLNVSLSDLSYKLNQTLVDLNVSSELVMDKLEPLSTSWDQHKKNEYGYCVMLDLEKWLPTVCEMFYESKLCKYFSHCVGCCKS